MSVQKPIIHYTQTDEAPALATASLLPIVQAFASKVGIEIQTDDISLSGRILANFSGSLRPDQQQEDALAKLGDLAKKPEANIIKLPNISASIPQLVGAIGELQAAGYAVPDFPEEPSNDQEREIRALYAKILGSAVNPVLREGNSDRRVADPVKQYAKNNPHSMGQWSGDSKTRVASMSEGDFYGSEQSHVMGTAGKVEIQWHGSDGNQSVLKKEMVLQQGEIIDSSVMSRSSLRSFLRAAIDQARQHDVLMSLHMKATMMKVSDPIIFGHCVSVYFEDVFDSFSEVIDQLNIEAKNGVGDIEAKIGSLDEEVQRAIREKMNEAYAKGPKLAMVDSDKGITNLHVPSDVIIDASMPAMIRSSGKMWGPDGKLHDTLAIIPDRCYAGVYQATIEFCIEHGAFEVSTMGSVSNVGLMAQKAEEYGSHDKTFQIEGDGSVRVVDASGNVLMETAVETGDIWRMCQTKDAPIRDWVRLAVSRAKATGVPAIFWLDSQRAHDANLIAKVNEYLKQHDTDGLTIEIMTPIDATRYTCQRCKEGVDTISVTGNVLRDYLTDLFPILELGTSAKMLSIVPLLAGGGLFETGAGGSAPKHVQQFVQENHLRWDSLGEFLAIGVSLEDLATKTDNEEIAVLADCLNQAIGRLLDENRSPSRKVKELDNRGSHFYLALYWAQSLAKQSKNPLLASTFTDFAKKMGEQENKIVAELNDVQGKPVDLGGYYFFDANLVSEAMRPSGIFNQLLNSL